MQNAKLYESSVADTRETFRTNAFNRVITEKDPKKLMSFWLNFCSKGVAMTEPVEGWIKRAGEKCITAGFDELGQQLMLHAKHEADHHLLMIDDTKKLVERWNKTYELPLDADILISSPLIASVSNYRKLHEDCIAGNSPYGQIAIEYEIENLTATYGKEVIQHTINILGEDIIECLSFLVDHARLDVGHTEFNRKVLNKFIEAHPQTTSDLINFGKQAVDIYSNVLIDYLESPVTFVK